MGLLDGFGRLQRFFRRNRRQWATAGRAHIELRTLQPEEVPGVAQRLETALIEHGGVEWARVNAFTRRIVVAFEPQLARLDELVSIVARVEDDLGLADRPFPLEGPEHPADLEPLVRDVFALGGDIVAFGFGLAGQLRRLAPSPIQVNVAALVSMAEGAPKVRRLVEQRVGPPVADLVLGVGNAFAQGIAQGPLGPVVDIAYRTSLLGELVARRRVWFQREEELSARPDAVDLPPLDDPGRPVPLPDGPVERYADRAWWGSIAGFGVGLALTRQVERAIAAIYAGVPKAARLGREAFAAQLGRTLAGRGVLAMDPQALRRLDRVDSLVVQGEVLVTGSHTLAGVEPVAAVAAAEARRRAGLLLDPEHPTAVQRRAGWALGPLDELGRTEPVAREGADAAGRAHELLGLVRGDDLVALVRTRPALAPGAAELLAAARRATLRVIVAGDRHALGESGVEEVVQDGPPLVRVVRDLQREGRVVCLVARGASPALRAADCGIGLHRAGEQPPWAADLLAGDDLADVFRVVESVGVARAVSRQSAMLAAAGAGVGAILAFGGLVPGTTQRTTTAVNTAAILAMVNGTRGALDVARRPVPIRRDATRWHALEVDDVLARLASSREGLLPDEATRRHHVPAGIPSLPIRYGHAVVQELANPLTPVLAAGAALSAAVGGMTDAAMVGGVMLLDALAGGAQRIRADAAIARLSRTGPRTVQVRRAGAEHRVESAELVPGDVVRIRAGEAVPADCRIIDATPLEVDESALTGESLPVVKGNEPSFSPAIAERTSMLYDGTSIAAGEAVGVVVAVGEDTEARTGLFLNVPAPRSGVEARLRSLTALTIPVSLLSGAAIVAVGFLRGRPIRDTLGAGVSLAVAAVPEGLPLLATVAQLGAARRLSARGVLVRNSRAIEALGRVNVVCADKTGTLTAGRIALQRVSDGLRDTAVDTLDHDLGLVLAVGLRAGPDPALGRPTHPTDRAIVEGATHADVTASDGAGQWRRLHELPFEPRRGFHAVVGETNGGLQLAVKGAPEVILPRCTTWTPDGDEVPLDRDTRARLNDEAGRLARRGLRVLAVAQRKANERTAVGDERVNNLAFGGFLALSDPARPTATAAVDGLRHAGVRVVMITGDHPSTAEGIAADLGLLDGGEVLTGPEIDVLDDEELTAVLPRVAVFARVSPAHKVRIVRALQHGGHTVAMTGDGANDAPAIRLADVGIALGSRATPAAQQAADLVMTDDRIETIVDALIEGRAMWSSVRDAVAILVGGNLGEIAFTLLGTLVAGRSPLNARQLLLVNLLTDAAPALAIALRPPREMSPQALLREGPEASLGTALDQAIVWRGIATAAGAGAAYTLARLTGTPGRARTVALVALVGTQLGQTLVIGGRSPVVAVAGLGSAAALAGIVQTPGLSQLFGSRPLGPLAWATALSSSAAATAGAVVLPKVVDAIGRTAARPQLPRRVIAALGRGEPT